MSNSSYIFWHLLFQSHFVKCVGTRFYNAELTFAAFEQMQVLIQILAYYIVIVANLYEITMFSTKMALLTWKIRGQQHKNRGKQFELDIFSSF